MSEDFDKSDFDKSEPVTKSIEEMEREIYDQVKQKAVKGLKGEKKKLSILENILREDETIRGVLVDFAETFVDGGLGYLYQCANSLKEIESSRSFLGAEDAAWTCKRLRIGMVSIMKGVGADMKHLE